MKRSNVLLLFLLILLTGISVFLLKSRSGMSTVDNDDRAFRIKDTGAVTKIFLADKQGNHVTVSREKDGWYANGKYKCRSEAILNLMEVMRLVEVKMPVPKQAKENILRFMSSNAIKVEIYSGDEKIKQYYVGHEPSDSEGSYMLLSKPGGEENFSDPFICWIPGFKGILQPRFITHESEWRDRLVINYTPPELSQIKVRYYNYVPDSSFSIDFKSNSEFSLNDLKGNSLKYDMGKMRQYLIYFQNISYEVLITGINKHLQDSLLAQGPFAEISLLTKNQKKEVYQFYRKSFSGTLNPEIGTSYNYDPDLCYMNFDRGKEWALVQYFVFGKLFITPGYFQSGSSVKK